MTSSAGPLILIIDDHEMGRYTLGLLLEGAGYRVREAATGAEGLAALEAELPDLVVLDVNLPDMDGRDVCSRIRTNPRTARLPVIHITASHRSPADQVAGFERGADAYLTQPYDTGVLLAIMSGLLRARAAERELQELRDELADRVADLEQLHNLTTRAWSSLDLNVTLHEVLSAVTGLQSSDMGVVMLYEERAGALHAAASRGLPRAFLDHMTCVPPGVGPCGVAIAEKRPVVIEDVENDPQWAHVLDIARSGGCRAAYSTPLLTARGGVLGTIATYFREPHRPSEREMRMVELYAAQAAQAIENAWLYGQAAAGRATLEALLEHVPEGIAIADAPDGRLRALSRFARELAGAGDEESAFGSFRRADGSIPPREEIPLLRAIRSGEVTQGEEWAVERPDGTRRVLLTSAGPIRDAKGNITGGVAAWRDITGRKQLEERMREVERAESIGRIAAGVAHDFNNLLTRILGGASLAIDLLDANHPSADLLADVTHAAERGSELTAQLLAYSGKSRLVVRECSLAEVVRQVWDLARRAVPIHIDMSLDLRPGLPPARMDSGQIQEVFLSLVANAAEAIGDRAGRITVCVGEEEVPAGAIGFAGDPPAPGGYVFLEVTDTGSGIDDATLASIFEPFFTTRFMGRGLGLSAVQGIVKTHRGGVRVRTAPGQGSSFRVLLPAEPVPAAAGRVRTVLVVDDEEMVARIAQLTLERAGYTVIVAASGAEALAAVERDAGIGLVLLDLKMPGMSGQETLARIRGLRPGLKVVLLTACDGAEAARLVADRETISGFVQKPYAPAELLVRLKPLLA